MNCFESKTSASLNFESYSHFHLKLFEMELDKNDTIDERLNIYMEKRLPLEKLVRKMMYSFMGHAFNRTFILVPMM